MSSPKIVIAKRKPEELIFHGDRPIEKAVESDEWFLIKEFENTPTSKRAI